MGVKNKKSEVQEPLQDNQVDSTHGKVEALEAMQLAKAGVEVPEDRIYYDDDNIQYDEDIDELTITSGIVELSWEEKARRAAAKNSY